MTEWIPVIVALLTIVGAAAAYLFQKQVDRRNALVELRRASYRDYLKAFLTMSGAEKYDPQIIARHNLAEMDLLVVGSDRVIKAVGALSRFYAETNHDRMNRDPAKVRRLVADVCRVMRGDCFEKTDLSVAEIEALVRIG